MNNDLISRNEVLSALEKVFEKYNISFNSGSGGFSDEVPKAIKSIPTAYDVDKVVEQVEEYAHSEICKSHNGCPYRNNEDINCENCGAMGTLEIVKSGGIE